MGGFQGEPSDTKASIICSDLLSEVYIESSFLIPYGDIYIKVFPGTVYFYQD